MTRLRDFRNRAAGLSLSLVATQGRIKEQEDRVLSLDPGSPHHRIASDVLLLLRDSLHVLTETQDLTLPRQGAGNASRGPVMRLHPASSTSLPLYLPQAWAQTGISGLTPRVSGLFAPAAARFRVAW